MIAEITAFTFGSRLLAWVSSPAARACTRPVLGLYSACAGLLTALCVLLGSYLFASVGGRAGWRLHHHRQDRHGGGGDANCIFRKYHIQ
ncbi:hypothetical protein [Cupriavidus basilensis]|uniref:Uncharacterized protein n=1 Tax=Cupriavidus basilensis TaxID=68895 RepID=A0A0C4YJ48_9BURK|nr:hypothetical protein [Cupriavidus basilensis]AJG21899.1 hypothetical protein RR42_s0303 [Cupriavidus basilensis]